MIFDPDYMIKMLPTLLRASLVTIAATAVGSTIAIVLGFVIVIMRRSPYQAIRLSGAAYVEFLRGTPLLIQLFFVFYILPSYGISLPPFFTGALCLGLYYATYVSEIYRAGIEAIPRGQWEAALALNMPQSLVWRRIIIPQAVAPVVPPLVNCVIAMTKFTPLLSTIGVLELLGTALFEAGRSYRYYEPLTVVGVIFLIFSLVAAVVGRYLENRFASRS